MQPLPAGNFGDTNPAKNMTIPEWFAKVQEIANRFRLAIDQHVAVAIRDGATLDDDGLPPANAEDDTKVWPLSYLQNLDGIGSSRPMGTGQALSWAPVNLFGQIPLGSNTRWGNAAVMTAELLGTTNRAEFLAVLNRYQPAAISNNVHIAEVAYPDPAGNVSLTGNEWRR